MMPLILLKDLEMTKFMMNTLNSAVLFLKYNRFLSSIFCITHITYCTDVVIPIEIIAWITFGFNLNVFSSLVCHFVVFIVFIFCCCYYDTNKKKHWFVLVIGKQRRLKQAKEEAQEEIEKYRLERDRQFKEFEAKVSVIEAKSNKNYWKVKLFFCSAEILTLLFLFSSLLSVPAHGLKRKCCCQNWCGHSY